MDKIHYSKETPIWETPDWLFSQLNTIYQFTVDVCALPENAKCKRFFSPEQDGLAQDWTGERCWMNPPYGDDMPKWIEKAATSNALTVALLPARFDTIAFHEWILSKPNVHVQVLKGRVKFVGAPAGAPFPSCLVTFRPTPDRKRP